MLKISQVDEKRQSERGSERDENIVRWKSSLLISSPNKDFTNMKWIDPACYFYVSKLEVKYNDLFYC